MKTYNIERNISLKAINTFKRKISRVLIFRKLFIINEQRVESESLCLRVVLGSVHSWKNILERNYFLTFFFFFTFKYRILVELRNTFSNLPIPKFETDLHKNDYFSNLVSTCSILYRILIEKKENFKIKSIKWSLIVENDSNSQVFAYWINLCETI